MKILVTGATGNVGSEVVRQLRLSGAPAVAGVRSVEKARRLLGAGVECRPFDFSEPATWQAALEGVEKIYLVIPPATTDASQVGLFFKKALETGVRHLVFNSGRTTGDLPGEPLNTTEGLVRTSGIGWTILRPGWFMQNFLHWLGFTIPAEDAFYLPAADARTAFADVRDLAAVAVLALTEEGHGGALYEPTSAEALDHFDVASKMSAAVGRTIRYVHLSDEEFVRQMVGRGWKEADAEFAVFLYRIVRTGKEERVSGDVERLLGRQAVGFEQFAQEHAGFWKKRSLQS